MRHVIGNHAVGGKPPPAARIRTSDNFMDLTAKYTARTFSGLKHNFVSLHGLRKNQTLVSELFQAGGNIASISEQQ